MVSVAATLSDWLYREVMAKFVLTPSRDYFRLRKPLERRIYEIAHKHCGRQDSWRVSVDLLLKKSGSASPRRGLRKMLRDMIAAGHLPDYEMAEEEGDMIRFSLRDAVIEGPVRAPPCCPPRRMTPPAPWHRDGMSMRWRPNGAASGPHRAAAPQKALLAWVKQRVARYGLR